MMEDLLRIIKELGSEDLRLLYIVALELKKGKILLMMIIKLIGIIENLKYHLLYKNTHIFVMQN